MADRGRGSHNQRGRAGGHGDRASRGVAGGNNKDSASDRKREAILDLAKFADKKIRVKFSGGREVEGVLKGWDQLLNLVLDDVEELVRDPETLEPQRPGKKRSLGLVVIRGTSLVVINPVDGFGPIDNPFLDGE